MGTRRAAFLRVRSAAPRNATGVRVETHVDPHNASRSDSMKNRLIGSLTAFFAAAGLGLAQPPAGKPIPLTTLPTKAAPSEGPSPYGELFHEACGHEQPTRVWFGAEELLWRIKSHPLPTPLATAAFPPFTSANPGAL